MYSTHDTGLAWALAPVLITERSGQGLGAECGRSVSVACRGTVCWMAALRLGVSNVRRQRVCMRSVACVNGRCDVNVCPRSVARVRCHLSRVVPVKRTLRFTSQYMDEMTSSGRYRMVSARGGNHRCQVTWTAGRRNTYVAIMLLTAIDR